MTLKRYLALLFAFGTVGVAQAQTPAYTQLYLQNPTLVSGSHNPALRPAVGSVYRYSNANRTSTNKTIDAYVQYVKTTNTGSDDVGLFNFDLTPATLAPQPGGFDDAFQAVTSCSRTNASGLWTRTQSCPSGQVTMSHSRNQDYLVHFRIWFKKGGTQIDTAINIKVSFIDIDGFGGGTEAEQNAFMPGVSYALAPSTTLTVSQRPDGLYNALGQPGNVGGIALTAITAITQITYLNRTFIDFGVGMRTANANASGGCYDAITGGRLSSVSFSANPGGLSTVINTTVTLSGKVWNDANSSGTSTWTNINNGSETGTTGGGMFVYALEPTNGTVVEKVAVANDGTYSFTVPKSIPVRLFLSSANIAEGTVLGANPSGTVNANWTNTTPQLRNSITPSVNVSNLDWGVQRLPQVNAFALDPQVNPGGVIRVGVPNAAFTGSDPEDGTFPVGLGGKKVRLWPAAGGDVYYNGVRVATAGDYLNFNPTLVTVDPAGTTQSAVTTTFDYSTYDAGNDIAPQKTVTVPFEAPITIVGTVWNDANGNAIKAGAEGFTNAGGLNAVLVDASNEVVEVEAVNGTTGAYLFDRSISRTTYRIIITTANPGIGTTYTAGSTLPASANEWVHTGVNISNAANTGNKTGIISVTTGAPNSGNLTDRNFGIEQTPAGADYTATSQLNPGGTTQVAVPVAAFTGTDPEDGTYTNNLTGRKVTLHPSNASVGDLYYNGTKVTAAQTITSFDPAKVTIDPAGTAVATITPAFQYQVWDNANVPSPKKTIEIPFEAPIAIGGTVWNDVNANAVKVAAEPFTNAGGLNAVLVNSANVVVDIDAVNATTGAYSFDRAISMTAYRIILTTANPALNSTFTGGSTLPAPANGAWVNTGTNIGGTASITNRTGIISFTTGAIGSVLNNRNFGIEQLPLADTRTAAGRPNPGDTLSVIVPASTFIGSDADGLISNIRITGFPTNTTSIQIGTTRYYPNAGAVPTSNCPATSCVVFPPAGIITPTTAANNTAYPTAIIRVDPVSGSTVVSIPFKTIDNGNMEGTVAGAANVPFTDPLPPVAQNIDNDPINSSAPYTHIGGFVASDPQGDPILSYTVLSLPPANSGVLGTCSSNSVPCTGTFTPVTVNMVLTPAQSQTLYFNPDSSFIGTVTFTYNATSKNGTSNTAVENIPVINNPPTANSFTTDPVQRNSSNNPVPPLSGADGDGVVVRYTVTPPVPAQGTLTYCTTPPSAGCGTPITTTVTLTPEQVKYISYTPAPNYTGITTFTYTTTDNNNLTSDPATVLIPVTNLGFDPRQLPPVTQNITLAPLNSASPAVPIAGLIGTDPDGFVASYKILTLPNPVIGTLLVCSNGTSPCNGTLSAAAVNQVLTPEQASSLQFDPAANNNNSPAKFTYSATDNDNLVSNTSTYTIPVTNQPPTAVAVQTKVPFNAANYPVPALQGTDDDGTINTYRILTVPNPATQGTLFTCSNNTVPCTGSYTTVSANTNLTPAQIASLTFTPVTGYIGTATGSYSVTDNNGKTSNPAPITLKIDNLYQTGRPPVAAGSTYTMGANDGTALLPGTFIRATDPDGSITSFTITSLPPVSQGEYTYCTTPPSTSCGNPLTVGLVLTPSQASSLRFTPDPTYSGPSYLGFFATDNDNNPSNLAVSVVNVSSKPPIANGYTTQPVKSGGPSIPTPLEATDLLDNGTVVSYTVTSIPNPADGSLSYCTSGTSGCNTPIAVGTTLTPTQVNTVRFTPGANISVHEVVYNFTAKDNSNNLSNVASIVVPVFDPMLCVNVRAYLEGALMSNGGATATDGRPLMRDNLRGSPFTNANYIPVRNPYEFATQFVNVTSRFVKYAPQNASYPVLRQVMDSALVFGASGQNAIVDWAFVELRDKANNALVTATRAGLMQRDGDIVDVDGTGCLAFPGVAIDSYFVSVRHRSHLGTMTKYGQSAEVLNDLVDMTVTTTPLYDRGTVSGFNFAGLSQKPSVVGNYRAMWQGDFNADGKVKYDNPNDDLAVMLFEVLNYPGNSNRATNYDFAHGYTQGDFDMNSKVKYDNPNDDNSSLLFQLLGYPVNANRATNFDFFLQQLP